MADLKQNLSGSFVQNPKMRIAIAGVVVVGVVVAGIVGWRVHVKHSREASISGAQIISTPHISSTPGGSQTSTQYAKDVQSHNLQQEKAARDPHAILAGSSNVPTINQPGFLGNINSFDNAGGTTPDGRPLCPEKTVATFAPNPAACTVNSLTSARQAGVQASELRCQGCTCQHLKAAGFNASNLKDAGFSVKALSTCGYQWAALRAAGFSAAQLKAAGASAAALKEAGYNAAQLKNAGYAAKDLLSAGYAPKDLVQAGYAAKELLDAGVSPANLKAAGLSAAQLAAAGGSANDLAQAGFTPTDIKAAMSPVSGVCSKSAVQKALEKGESAQALIQKGCSIAALRTAGITAAQLKAAGVSAAALKAAGYTASDLKTAGFTPAALKNAGYSAAQLKNAGYSAADLKNAGFDAKALKAAGYTAAALKNAGFDAQALKGAGFSAGQLKTAGYNAKALKDAGFNAKQLKAAGYAAKDLLNAGVSPKDIAAAGYTKGDLLRAGLSPADIGLGALPTGSSTGKCAVQSLREQRLQGITATQGATNGCSIAALRAAGYTAANLVKAGFTPTQLHDVGFTARQVKAAGVTPAQLKTAGFSPREIATGLSDQAGARGAVDANGNAMNGAGDMLNSSNGGIPSLDPAARTMSAIQQKQAEQVAKAQLETQKSEIYGLMNSEATKLLSGWAKPSNITLVQGEENTSSAAAAASVNGAHATTAKGMTGATGANASGKVIKAGNVMFGVLTIGLNTDEKSPIMARIISGQLKGSTLMGSFTRENTKVMIKFDRLNMPGQKSTISIDLVAIDPSTARTVVAGHVNHHYLLKYGSLFASGFLGSLGQALTNSNSFCIGGVCFQQHSGFSTAQQVMIGLGGVGTQIGNKIGTKENTAPTVSIPAGTSIGLLLMNDFSMPKSNLPKPVLAPHSFNNQVHAQ